LLSLHQRAEEALREPGFARERREFSPHLTVARLKDRTAPIDGQRAVEALLSAREFESGLGMNVESVSLMRSVLLPDGARHQRLASMPLADDSAQVAPG
jgi:2'-5' RNA ligase